MIQVTKVWWDGEKLMAEPIDPASVYKDSACNNALRAQGNAYPRTCKKCGFGPCAELAQRQKPVVLKWQQAPLQTAWGDEMVVASVAIDKDHTVSLYCEREQTAKVEAMFAKPAQTDWEAVAADQAMTIALLRAEQPAQRTWVGLTDDEIYSVLENLQVMHHRPPTTDSRVIFALAIEAKLKEKNT